jgi:hypothetical protein
VEVKFVRGLRGKRSPVFVIIVTTGRSILLRAYATPSAAGKPFTGRPAAKSVSFSQAPTWAGQSRTLVITVAITTE